MRYKKEMPTALDKIGESICSLLSKKPYVSICSGDIIKESGVSRSTYYLYFKSKDDVINYVCDEILNKAFVKNDGDLYLSNAYGALREERERVLPILNSQISEIFLKKLRKKVKPMVIKMMEKGQIGHNNAPYDLKIHQYVNSFASLLQYYLRHEEQRDSQEVASWYLKICH